MQSDVNEVIEAALKLPPEVRGALATRLIESLESQDADPDAEASWAIEIARRVQELDTGESVAVPWSEARRQILRDK